MRRLLSGAAVAAILASGSGCLFDKRPAEIKSQAFIAPQTQPVTRSAENKPVAENVGSAPRTNTTTVRNADPTPSAPPATQPAPVLSTGNYMIVGTVVAEANGQPVYADKVLAKLDAALRAQARKYARDRDLFRAAARALIDAKIMEDVREELEFAAADRNTSDEEKQIATMVTTQFRQKEITKAGGSLAVARAHSLEDGQDFDEKTNEEYRRNLIRLYYAKKVFPKVSITVEEMRQRYERDKDRLYTERSEAKFRVIRIGVQETGSKDEAFAKIKRAHDRARAGENFGELAAAQNDRRDWARQRGYMEAKKDEKGQIVKDEKGEPVGVMVAKGTYGQLEELEKAVFALNVGQITEIIDIDGAYYIAKLEAKTDGRVRAFEEEAVQTAIRDLMEQEQRGALRKKEQKKLLDASVTRMDDKMVDVAVEMAMQKFATWARSE